MPEDEFDRLTEGLTPPNTMVEYALIAGQQTATFYTQLKAVNIPDATAEFLTRCWMEMGAEDGS